MMEYGWVSLLYRSDDRYEESHRTWGLRLGIYIRLVAVREVHAGELSGPLLRSADVRKAGQTGLDHFRALTIRATGSSVGGRFLRLYRENLLDIKYFNNELTNIEYKKLAGDLALQQDLKKDPLIEKMCLEFLRVERNFVLKKGETAASVPEDKSTAIEEGEFRKQLVETIKDLGRTIIRRG